MKCKKCGKEMKYTERDYAPDTFDCECGDWIEALMAFEEMKARAEKAENELERERVRLAGCGVVALGCKEHDIKKDDYGYSASYQDVLNLRNQLQSATHTMDDAVNKLYKVEEENERLLKQNIELMAIKDRVKAVTEEDMGNTDLDVFIKCIIGGEK